MKRRAWILAAVCTPAASLLAGYAETQAATTSDTVLAEGLRTRLGQPDWLQGEFEQSKQVQGFKRPLLSRGDFVVARGRGVLWRTRSPFVSEIRLTRDQIQAQQNGASALRMDTQKEPALRLVNEMMFALLGGDLSSLSALFEMQGELIGSQAWRVTLMPRQAAWRQVLRSLTLAGERHVREVRVTEASGDQTEIRFSQLREGAPVPSPTFD